MDPLAGKRLLILGLARQGKALARFAAGVGARVVVSDLRPAALLQAEMAELADLQIEYVLGEHPMRLLDNVDMVAVSGSVPADAPLVAEARRRGLAVTNDSQEFVRRTPTAVIGITGSAGKTTTTALTGVMGQVGGRRTWVGGNIGRPLLADLHKMAAGDMVVQELSSFQLEIWQQSPPIAAVLNITPNHLDRHKTMPAYVAAKANILRHQPETAVAVLSADDPGSLALQRMVRGRLRLFSDEQPVADGAFVHNGYIYLRDDERETAVCSLDDIQLRGRHNLRNVLAAITLADSVGIEAQAMRRAIRTFRGVEHRLEQVAVIRDVTYVNDSIATAPERALAALAAFDEPLLLLAGGRDKDMVWEEWAGQVAGRVRHTILFGQLAPKLAELLTAVQAPFTQVETLADAVVVAAQTAVAGDLVLLSPGGTSYDAYRDFAERGEHFRELVNSIQ
jgi:UDP-N-acetylmuramoylalanine--D-glutamate ligase